MNNVYGKSVKLFYENNHEGIVYAEMMNWTGFVVSAPRTALNTLYHRQELQGSGIYFLLAEDSKQVYVGETVQGIARMRDHDGKKDFWERIILVQSKDFHLTKTHCSYLEHRCAQIITKDSEYTLENAKALKDYTGTLPRADINDMEVFLANLQFILPALGVLILNPLFFESSKESQSNVYDLELEMIKDNVSLFAYIQNEQIVVKAGSIGRSKDNNSLSDGLKHQRKTLIEKGFIEVQADQIQVKQDIKFSSLSSAAACMLGYPVSGPQHWKVKGQELTYKEWEVKKLELYKSDI